MKIRWTERASRDALSIYDYIADRSPVYANSVYERILQRPSELVAHPASGSIVPELNRADIREVFVHSFRLIYRVDNDEIRILAVIHGSRQLPTDLPGGD